MQNHPLAWWSASALIALCVLHRDSSVIAAAAIAIVGALVFANKSQMYWHRTFALTIKLSLAILIIRMAIGIVIGVPMPGAIIFRLPEISLPNWLAGIRIGGDVTSQRLQSTFHESLILIALLLIFGAVNSLVSPHRLIKTFPRAIYNIGTTLVIATSALPQLVASLSRIKQAKKLRGQSNRGVKAWRSIAVPLLEESLARAIDLSAAMESRGYGYVKQATKYRPIPWRKKDSVILALAAIPTVVLW